MTTFLIFLSIWAILGFFAYALILGYFFNNYGYDESWKENLKIYLLALFLFSSGGVGFAIALIRSHNGKYGLRIY